MLVALRVATLLLQVAQKVVVDWYDILDIQKRRNPMVQETVDILYPILCPYAPMTHPFYDIPSMTFLLCTRQRAFIIQSLNYHPNCPLFPLSKQEISLKLERQHVDENMTMEQDQSSLVCASYRKLQLCQWVLTMI